MPATFLALGYIAGGSASESNMVVGLHVTEMFYATFFLLPYFNRQRSRAATLVWLVVLEAVVWMVDYWMYAIHAHSWSLMLQTDWLPALYIAVVLLLALVVPRLSADARVPEQLTMGGLTH
jgi:hypothetical protein